MVCAALVGAFACSSSSQNAAESSCTPATTRSCAAVGCPTAGSQSCDADGKSWGSCVCGAGGSAGAGTGGTNVSGAGGGEVGGGSGGIAGAAGSNTGGSSGADGGGACAGYDACEFRVDCCSTQVPTGPDAFESALQYKELCSNAAIGCYAECHVLCAASPNPKEVASCVDCVRGSADFQCDTQACSDYVACFAGCVIP
jgi:hypothetical protein